MNLHEEFFGICDELEAGVVNSARIGRFLDWTRTQKSYSLYRRRNAKGVEVDPIKDAIVVRLASVAAGKQSAIESASLLRKQFALLNAPAVDDQDNELDSIAFVRVIVNKVRKMKLSQSEKGAKIASQVDDELFVKYITSRGLKTKVEEKASHFTRLVKDCDGAKGVPQWLKG